MSGGVLRVRRDRRLPRPASEAFGFELVPLPRPAIVAADNVLNRVINPQVRGLPRAAAFPLTDPVLIEGPQ
jgi:hypothetical protein